jgi:tetratricopeptide (TPR) repeat protein
MDQEGEAIAMSTYSLADVIHRQKGDLLKAEKLAREALRIISLVHNSDDQRIGSNCNLLSRILQSQGKFEDETKELFERSLAIDIRNEGPDGSNTAISNLDIGNYYYKYASIGQEEIFLNFEITYRGTIPYSNKDIWLYSSEYYQGCIPIINPLRSGVGTINPLRSGVVSSQDIKKDFWYDE